MLKRMTVLIVNYQTLDYDQLININYNLTLLFEKYYLDSINKFYKDQINLKIKFQKSIEIIYTYFYITYI